MAKDGFNNSPRDMQANLVPPDREQVSKDKGKVTQQDHNSQKSDLTRQDNAAAQRDRRYLRNQARTDRTAGPSAEGHTTGTRGGVVEYRGETREWPLPPKEAAEATGAMSDLRQTLERREQEKDGAELGHQLGGGVQRTVDNARAVVGAVSSGKPPRAGVDHPRAGVPDLGALGMVITVGALKVYQKVERTLHKDESGKPRHDRQ